MYYSTKNSENERSIPVIGSFLYLNKTQFLPHLAH